MPPLLPSNALQNMTIAPHDAYAPPQGYQHSLSAHKPTQKRTKNCAMSVQRRK